MKWTACLAHACALHEWIALHSAQRNAEFHRLSNATPITAKVTCDGDA